MFTDWPRPVIFAHRGSSAHAPENTLAAFKLAHQHGADAIELDAMLCADGQIVVIHDNTLDRTTDGTGFVASVTLDSLKKLDAGSHFDVAYRGEKIPTLAEVFDAVGRQFFINIELKNYTSLTDDLPQRACALVREYGLQDWVMFSSFNPLALIRTHRCLPDVPNGLLTDTGRLGKLLNSPLGRLIPHHALHPALEAVNQHFVHRLHATGRRIHVYTVNSHQDLVNMFSLGVDGVFTDDPLLARQVLHGLTESVG